MSEIYSSNWSETAMNNNANSPDGWQGGTTFPNIPKIGREMMGAIKREWNRSHPTLACGGTATAITLTPTTALTGYVTGQILAGKLSADLGASATLNVSALGAKKIYFPALAGGYEQPDGSEVVSGASAFFYYDATLDSGSGGFVIYSYRPISRRTESIPLSITSENGALPALSSGTVRFEFRMPYAFQITGAVASLKVAQTSGSIITLQLEMSSPSFGNIFSTKLTIDNGELTSTTAATPVAIGVLGAVPSGADLRVYITLSGDGTARGLKLTLLGYQT